jgi:hypothetical protein
MMTQWFPLARRAIIVGIMVMIPLVVFFPYLCDDSVLLGPRSGLGTDITYRHWPDLTYLAHIMRTEHTIALWDDSVAGGRPLAGDPGILWLYPFTGVFLFMPPALAFNWSALLHVLIAGSGSYLFLRKGIGLSSLASLVGGIAYMLSPKFIAHLAGGHVGLAFGASWIPWALLGTHRAVHGDWRGMLLAGIALAFQMPTHIQIPFYTAWLMVAYAIWKLLTLRSSVRSWRRLLVLAGIIPSFVMLSAALLLPLVEILPYTSRTGLSLENAAWYSLPPWLIFALFSPSNFQFPEWVLYPGATTLVLAFVALFGDRRREVLFWFAVIFFSLAYAVGPATPVFPLLHHLPGFAQLRVPPRIWFLGGFSFAVLAALGAEVIASRETFFRMKHSRTWLRLLALIVLGAGVGTVVGLLLLHRSPYLVITTLAISLATIGLLVAFHRHMLSLSRLHCALLLLLVVELVPTARLYTQAVPVSSVLRRTDALDYLSDQSGLWRVYSSHGELPYASAAEEGIEAAEGLLALQIGHYVDLIKLASGCLVEGYGTGVPPCLTTEIDPLAYRRAMPQAALLGLLNVRYVLASQSYDQPSLKLVARFGEERLYRNDLELPRAFTVFNTEVLPSQESVLESLNYVDPGQTALLADPLPNPVEAFLPAIPAEIVGRTANTMDVSIQIPLHGLLVVSRTWMPGWQASINGEPVPVYRVNYALQGVFLPPGEHEIHFQYQPWGWQLGWPLTAVAFLVAALLLGQSAIRHGSFWKK